MQNSDLFHAMFYRMSVRKYDQTPLTREQIAELKAFWNDIPPVDGSARYGMDILTAHQVSRNLPAPNFVIGYAADDKVSKVSAGYAMQHLDLYLASKGLGGCYNGYAAPHKTFGELCGMPVAMPMAIGLPATPAQRTGPSAFKRKDTAETALPEVPRFVAEAVRVAPSAMNLQPWTLTGDNSRVELRHSPRGLKAKLVSSMAYIDMGIALAHICIAARQQGAAYQLDFNARPEGPIGKNDELVCTIRFE